MNTRFFIYGSYKHNAFFLRCYVNLKFEFKLFRKLHNLKLKQELRLAFESPTPHQPPLQSSFKTPCSLDNKKKFPFIRYLHSRNILSRKRMRDKTWQTIVSCRFTQSKTTFPIHNSLVLLVNQISINSEFP